MTEGRNILALAALAFGLAVAAPAAAQNELPNPRLVDLGQQIWKDKATCRNCHGGLGHGIQDIPQEPQGANFRETQLTPEQFHEVVRCGRPGTEMPHFERRAYTDDRCYGLTAADLGADKPAEGQALSNREIDALVSFIFTSFVGQGPPTFEDCIAFWGEGASTCTRYPRAAN